MPFKRYTDRTFYVEFCEWAGVKYIKRDNGEQMKARVLNFLNEKNSPEDIKESDIWYVMHVYMIFNSKDMRNDNLLLALNKKVLDLNNKVRK
jgi:hypothetical protein